MKVLINETTKEERKALVEKAFGISLTGGQAPSTFAIELAKQYVDGEKELAQIQKEMIERYKKND